MGACAVARKHADEGMSLVELLVVMLLSAILMTAVGAMFVSVARQTVHAQDVRRSTADASNIMNVVTTTIRASIPNAREDSAEPDPAIVRATPFELTVISYTDAGPSFPVPLMIRYRVDGEGRMVEDRWAANGCRLDTPEDCDVTYAVFPDLNANPGLAPQQTRILGSVVVNASDDSNPLFRYYTAACTSRPTTGNADPAEDCDTAAKGLLGMTNGRLSTDDRKEVATVRFNVKVRADDSDEVVTLDSTVGIPNLNYRQEEG